MSFAYVIFGATGDLMHEKLWPALSALFAYDRLPEDAHILAIGRRPWDTKRFLEEAQKRSNGSVKWDALVSRVHYVEIDLKEPKSYRAIKDVIDQFAIDERVFYLATPPKLFPVIAKGIFEAGLAEKGNTRHRVVFEKPFGEDLTTAREINQTLWHYFDEDQMYRIDHYLGKEMIQNIFAVRFGNKLFESIWHHEDILDMSIIAEESVGIKSRGPYYDGIGALKDMVQSHLLQMAALITMDPPKNPTPDNIKDQKVHVLKRISVDPKSVVAGQYEGYLEESGVPNDSHTETAIFFKACVATPRFYDVPIFFLSGKKLSQKRSEIRIRFKPHALSHHFFDQTTLPNNELIIKVAPEEGVSLTFNVKKPGLDATHDTVSMDYMHTASGVGNVPEAYEKLLLDVANSNPTLFTRWDEIETSWSIIDAMRARMEKPKIYKDGAHFKAIIEEHRKEVNDDLRCVYGDYADDDSLQEQS